ncbi:MAG: transglutaminase-like domain-containing protein, partial [Cellulomonadaceae bacterium]
ALVGAAVVVGARARGWQPFVVVAVLAVLYLLCGGPLAAPSTTVARVVPTLDTVTGLLAGVVTSWKEMLTLTPPLGSVDTLLVVPYLLALVGTAGAGMLATGALPAGPGQGQRAVRVRAVRTTAAAAVPVLVGVLAILLGTVEAPLATVVGTALIVLLVPWAAWRQRRWHPRRHLTLVLMAAVGISAGVFVSPHLAGDAPRYVLRNDIVPPFDPRDQISPLAGYRTFVKDLKETDLVTVRDLPDGGLVRLATMDAFDGVVWNVAGSGTAEGSGAFRRVGDVIPTSVRGVRADVAVEIGDLTGIWLPTVGQTTGVDFFGRHGGALRGSFRFNDATGTAVVTSGLATADRYELGAVLPGVPDDETLGDAQPAAVILPEPQAVPESVASLAGEITTSATTPALIARALEAWLAEGYFSHGNTTAGDYPSLSGHGAARVNELLTASVMVGDSEQYASAMALMARHLGLPARVVLGFVPDETQAGADEIVFTGDQVQAWVEIAYEGYGWVPYFPTPPSTRTPSDDVEERESQPQPQVVQPPPPPEDPITPPREDVEEPDIESPEDVEDDGPDLRRIIIIATAIGLPLLLLLVPPLVIVAAKARRRRRRRTAAQPLARATGAWDEIVDVAREHDHPASALATRRENARALAAAYPSAPVEAVALRADTAVFAPGEPDEHAIAALWNDTDRTLAVITGEGSWWRRLRGQLSRASLRARRRERRVARRGRQRANGRQHAQGGGRRGRRGTGRAEQR